MELLPKIIVAIVAAIHMYVVWLEMFAWTTAARKTFRKFPPELFEKTRPMAANQGLYNGFLAAGLIWSCFITEAEWSVNVAAFFLCCVFIAGVFGAVTIQRAILYVQALPALAGLIALYLCN